MSPDSISEDIIFKTPDPPSAGMLCMPEYFVYYESVYPYMINNDDKSGSGYALPPFQKSISSPTFDSHRNTLLVVFVD